MGPPGAEVPTMTAVTAAASAPASSICGTAPGQSHGAKVGRPHNCLQPAAPRLQATSRGGGSVGVDGTGRTFSYTL